MNEDRLEVFVIGAIRHFFLRSGSFDGDFYVNEFSEEYVDAVIDEQCKITTSLNH